MNRYLFRTLQIAVVASFGLFAALIFAGNLMSYNDNYQFVQHVFAMDTVFPDNTLKWRAIDSPVLVNIAYVALIVAEGAIALLCLTSATRMLRRITRRSGEFERAKNLGLIGLILVIAVWFVGFLCIGSEWFSMWESQEWNGRPVAFGILAIVGPLTIIFVLPERHIAPAPDSEQ